MSKNRVPHPVCGHLKPLFAHRETGPCDWCLKDVEREYLPPDTTKTWNDIRAERRPLLELTDWVDTHPARASRVAPEYLTALTSYRQALLDITETFESPELVVWPTVPLEDDYH